MDQRLQTAIDAAKMGDTRSAQQVLAQLLKEDPDQVHAWFLLSHLVESKEKQTAYLGKVLSLDPAHEQARQRLAFLSGVPVADEVAAAETQPAMSVAPDVMDMESQARGDTLPSWMDTDDAAAIPTQAAPAAVAQPAVPADEIPDWLQKPVDTAWEEDEKEMPASTSGPAKTETAVTTAQPTMAVAAPTQKEEPEVDKSQLRRLNLLLIVLILFALIVAFLLLQEILAL